MSGQPIIVVIDDHESMRSSLRALLESAGFQVKDYPAATAYLDDGAAARGDCMVVDVRMPGMSGIELQEELVRRSILLPVIVMTGNGDVALAVRAMKAGAVDFLEKPFDDEALLAVIQRALSESRRTHDLEAEAKAASQIIGLLTDREREVFQHLVLGKTNKLIAYDLGISPRTVEIHRARLQEKMHARDLSDLVRTAMAAGQLH